MDSGGREVPILDHVGLLSQRTVLAHCVHISADEVKLIAKRGTSVAHCPLSNAFFAHGVLRVRWLWEHGVTVGLATDVAGGHDPSMLSALRAAIFASHILEHGTDRFDTRCSPSRADAHARVGGQSTAALPPLAGGEPGAGLSIREALWLATVGGAQALGKWSTTDGVGSFEIGKSFDALAINPYKGSLGRSLVGSEPLEERIEKFLRNGDDRNVESVWVQGRLCVEQGKSVDTSIAVNKL